MAGTIRLETGRLLLRRYRTEDAGPLYQSFGRDPEFWRYSGWNPYSGRDRAEDHVRQFIDSYADPHFYGWVIEWKPEDPVTEGGAAPAAGSNRQTPAAEAPRPVPDNGLCGEIIGTIGAYDYDPESGSIEAGLSIRRDQWGRGIASEALRAVLEYLTGEEGIACVRAWCAAPNTGSKRAMEKAGMVQTAFEAEGLRVGDRVYDRLDFEYRIPVDLTFSVKQGIFNYRVGAVIIHDGKLLLMKNDEEPYYYTVGGRVRFNETTEETVLREVREEIGIDLEIDRFLFFQEQFFDGKVTGTHVHELGVYYLMKDSPALENLVCHSVTARGVAEGIFWIPLEEAASCYIVPESVAARLRDLPLHPEHLIEIDER